MSLRETVGRLLDGTGRQETEDGDSSTEITIRLDTDLLESAFDAAGRLQVPLDSTTYHALASNERRRHVVRELADVRTTTLGELAEQQAIREADDGVVPDGQAYKTARINLYQVHLPKLAEWGVLEYDTRSNDVVATDSTTAVATLLAVDEACLTGGGGA